MSEIPAFQYKVSFLRRGRDFDLLDSGDTIITSLKQENSRFSIAFFDSLPFEIISTDFWGRAFRISDNGLDIGDMRLKFWQEKLFINMSKNERIYVLKSKGGWDAEFVLEDQNENEVLSLKEKSNWGKVSYLVTIIDPEKIEIEIEKFLVICGYATDVITSNQSSD